MSALLRVLIENEAGSRRKNTYDEHTLAWLKAEDVSAPYPFPYGFIIGTRAGDSDAADCFVLTTRKLAAGTIVECEAAGLLEQVEDSETDHKVLAVLRGETFALTEAETALRDFASRVFAHIPGKQMSIGRLLDSHAAAAYIRGCAPP
jgi:inorganic pyrophosphatase